MRDNSLRATMNGGGPELQVRTGDGSIVLEPYAEGAAGAHSSDAWDDKATGTRHGVRPVRRGH